MVDPKDTLVLVTSDGMGRTDDADLRRTLLAKWLDLVIEGGHLPGAMAFYTDGVRLAVEGSPVLERLKALEAKGVRLVLCKTCLDRFGLTDRVRAGVVGGMGDIIAAQWTAAKVVAL
jgi:sulfur relay (sulfurtransferase) complex TusBCD TusD component (DsrE family)